MSSNKYCLGLDISTSIVGLSLFKENKMIKLFHIDLTKTKCIFEKAMKFEKEYLENINSNIVIEKIYRNHLYPQNLKLIFLLNKFHFK